MTTQQPEALRLAEKISDIHCHTENEARAIAAAADSLCSQHARIAELEAKLSSSGFTAADMATASAQGFRDGVASIAASAGSEPVAHLWQHCETGRTRIVMPDMIVGADASWQVVGPLYLGAAPPTAQAEGWRLVPVEPTAEMLRAGDQKTWVLPALECWRAMLAAAPNLPTSAEGVEHV